MAETLYTTGTVGITNGFKWISNAPASEDIDADNDGVMTPNHGALIDLSQVASELLGKQCGQMSHYSIKRLWVSMRNNDDGTDNDESTYFAGTFRWWHPTDHRKEAMRLARSVEKATEMHEIDLDSYFLSTDDDYSGLRFGWGSTAQYGNDQVNHPTNESVTGHPGNEWGAESVFQIYNTMLAATKTNSLWGGRAGSKSCKIPWSTSAATGVGAGDAPAVLTDWNSGRINAKALGGLLYFNVSHSALDEEGAVDDDYFMVVGIEFQPEQGRF